MIESIKDYQDSVLFETYILDRLIPIVDHNQNSSIDLRGEKIIRTASLISSSDARDKLINKFAPLLFGAAWKVLDLGIELSLNQTNPKKKNWLIKDKCDHAKQGAGCYKLLTRDRIVWEVVTALYANTAEHRHCLVHRTACVDINSGELTGKDKSDISLQPLTLNEQKAIARIALLVSNGFISGGLSSRNKDHLLYWLDQVIAHSNKPPFNVDNKCAPVSVLTTLEKLNDHYIINIANDVMTVNKHYSQRHFDFYFLIPDGTQRQLYAQLENIPLEETSIKLNNLPNWLSFA